VNDENLARWQLYIKQRTVVDPMTGCWNWQLSLQSCGYGQVNAGRKEKVERLAHRLSYSVFVGPIPAELDIRHQCHNRRCCNPAHLLLGTNQDNKNDNKRDGIRHSNAVLTVAQVAEIKRLLALGTHTQRQVGALFSVSPNTIGSIAAGNNWADVQPATSST
jgi:hypothetical protein